MVIVRFATAKAFQKLTGQNPASSTSAAQALMKVLGERKAAATAS
jgi:hypothetical protein